MREKDPDALLSLSVKLANDLKAAMERHNQNPGNNSKPSGSLAPWEKAGQDDDDDPPPDEGRSGKGREKATSGNTAAHGGEDETPAAPEEGSARKPGRQPGSPGFGRSQKFEVSETKQYHAERCAGCNAPLPFTAGIAYTGFDTVDVEFGDTHRPGLHLRVIRHQYFQTACPCCGLENRATPRREAGDAVWGKTALSEWRLLGPASAALIVYLSLDMRITRRKVKQLLVDLFALELSTGTIQNCLVESGRALEPVEQQIVEALLDERLLHADETGHNEAGTPLWLWVFVTSSAALYLIGRRTQELFDNLLDALETPYRGWLISDGYGVYRHYANRLRCWAHLIRKAKGLCDS